MALTYTSKMSTMPIHSLHITPPPLRAQRSLPTTVTYRSAATTVTTTAPLDDAAPGPPHRPTETKKKVLVPIAMGSEEMEAVILVDVLRRAGADVIVASVEPELEVVGSLGIRIVADARIEACADKVFDLVTMPGGMPGSVRLRDNDILRSMTIKHAEENRLYGAISAGPAVVLVPWGLHKRKKITGHPAFMDKLPTFRAVQSNIQVSGGLTTSRGPGTAFEFALSFVEQLFGANMAEDIGKKMMARTDGSCQRKEEFNKVEWHFDQNPQVLVPVANGSEEMEVVILIDILRRAKVNVVVASIEKSKKIVGSSGIKLLADKTLVEASESRYDLIILPGGFVGVERLGKSRVLKKILGDQMEAGRICGAICSSPFILQKQGLLKDKIVTAHPVVSGKLTCKVAENTGVVIDGKLITSQGLGTVIDFSLAIISKLFGHGRARCVAEGLVFEYPKS